MPIQTTCPECQRPLRVPDDLIGQEVRCPGCSTAWTVEAPAADSAPPAALSEKLDEGVRETLPPAEPRPAADEHVRENVGGSAGLPQPPARFDDDIDDDEDLDDDDEFERGLEGRYGRHHSAYLVARAKSKLLGPSIGVLIVAGLVLVMAAFRLLTGLLGVGMAATGGPTPGSMFAFQGIGLGFGVLLAVLGGLAVFGGIQMVRLRSWGWSLAACILVMLPNCECCFLLFLLGLPFGIWGVVVLCQPEVKQAFQLRPTLKRSLPDPDEDVPE